MRSYARSATKTRFSKEVSNVGKLNVLQDRPMRIIAHIVLSIMSLFAAIPFCLLIAASFSDADYAVQAGYRFIPKVRSLAAYEYILTSIDQIGRAYMITVIVTGLGTACGLIISSLFAYGLSNDKLPGRNVLFAFVILTMLFSGGIVPQYMVYNNYLKMKNTLFGLIIPNLLMSGFTIVLIRNYFKNDIPVSLSEAMSIDGAGAISIFIRLYAPLSVPIFATVGIMSAITYWNDWNNGLYYISDSSLYSIQQLLSEMNNNVNFLANNASRLSGVNVSELPSATIRLAIAVVAILPVMIVYPFFQKYFIKGITMGAVKG